MGRNKNIRKRISSLQRHLREHESKIERELDREFPDLRYIAHWELEIKTWKDQMKQLERRLKREW